MRSHENLKIFRSPLQIVSHSRSRDGTWLSPDNLRQILTGLEACPTGSCSCVCASVCQYTAVIDLVRKPHQLSLGANEVELILKLNVI